MIDIERISGGGPFLPQRDSVDDLFASAVASQQVVTDASSVSAYRPVIPARNENYRKEDAYCNDRYNELISSYQSLLDIANDPDLEGGIFEVDGISDMAWEVVNDMNILLEGYCSDKLSTQQKADLETARDELLGLLGRFAAEGPDTTFVEFLQGNAEVLRKIGATLANLGALFGFPMPGKNPLLQP